MGTSAARKPLASASTRQDWGTPVRLTQSQQMLVGGAWLALGAIAFAIAWAFGEAYGLFGVYAFAFIGALMFVAGAARSALGEGPEDARAEDAKALRRSRAVVRSLLAVAAADKTLAERELNVIENFASKLADVDIGDDLVRELFEETAAQPVSIKDELSGVVGEMSDADKVTVYQGAALVAYCLDAVGPHERAALDDIAAVLKLPPETVRMVEQRAQEAFADDGLKYWLGL